MSKETETQLIADLNQQPNVLIVEDDVLISMHLEEIVKIQGCKVVGPFRTLKDALGVVEKFKIDVAVIDYWLSDGDAELLGVALNDRAIPFAICTGAGKKEICSRFPNTPILSKPFTTDDVSLVISSLIASHLARNRLQPMV